MKKLFNALLTKQCAYVSFILSGFAFMFLKTADWSYSWIAESYPLGKGFVPTLFCIITACFVISFGFIIHKVLSPQNIKGKGASAVFGGIYIAAFVFSVISFLYTFALVLHLDWGISLSYFVSSLSLMGQELASLGVVIALVLPLMFVKDKKEILRSLISSFVIAAIILSLTVIGKTDPDTPVGTLPEITLNSDNLLKNAAVSYETLKEGEKPDASNLLADDGKCWTPQDPDRTPAEGYPDANNSVAEIQFAGESTFNTALIEENGSEVQYFRLQAMVDGEWVTVYQSEKIQSMRICSFDPVTTSRVRLSVDKFRSSDTPAKIRSFSLYNETPRDSEDFEVTAYQRLDGDVPTEILARGEEYVNNYAKFYDVYSTVIVFAAVHWDENGNMNFGDSGEDEFARQINALKEIISHRSNKSHEVKLVVTALADGAWGDEHNGVNTYMTKYWESVADKIVEFVNKYEFAGVDIDWEYPQTSDDWEIYDSFIARLDDGMQKTNPQAVISAALSSGSLGMSKETLDRLDQIQFMAYDGNDEDGYQSSLQQAQEGLQAFIENGADISKINIGIAAYGRPVNSTPYWASWRDLTQANYWDNKYYNVHDSDQVYDGTFCSPALAGDKTAYAIMSGAGGVMVFRVACDKTMDDPNSVACGVQNALNRYFTEW